MPAVQVGELPGQRQRPARRIARCAHGRKAPPAGSPARSRAAVDRRQRHLFLRPGRRRHRRHRNRARAVPPHRRDGIGRRFTRRAGARPAARLRQAARGAEAAGRRPLRVSSTPPTPTRRCRTAARLVRAGAPVSIFIRPSTPTRSGSPTSPASCRTNSCRN